jgi:hypothetical protein
MALFVISYHGAFTMKSKIILIFILLFLYVWLAFLTSCSKQDTDQKDAEVEYVTDPCLIPIAGNRFKLCENMIIRVHDVLHEIPKGFKTDLASIPRFMWPLFAPTDYDSIAAAVLHDWHYCCVQEVSRKSADDIFYYSLRNHGMGRAEAYLYYLGVRSSGWLYYQHGKGLLAHKQEFAEEDTQGAYDDGVELG